MYSFAVLFPVVLLAAGCTLGPHAETPTHALPVAGAVAPAAERLLELERRLGEDPADGKARAARDALLADMGAIEERRSAGWIALEGGYDSNFNNGIDTSEIAVPLLRVTRPSLQRLTRDLQGRPSALAGLNAGAETRVADPRGWRLRFSAAGHGRLYAEEEGWTPHALRLGAEAGRRMDAFAASLAVSVLRRGVGRRMILASETLSGRLDFDSLRLRGVSLVGSRAQKRYPFFDGLSTHESEWGVAVSPASSVTLAGSVGRERSDSAPSEMDRDFTTLQAEWRVALATDSVAILSAHHSHGRFLQWSPLFLVNRAETFRELALAWDRALGASWYFTPRAILQDNRSNIPITRFKREQWLLELRKEY